MHRYWDIIIEPIVSIIRPQSIIEIGAESGKSTAMLLEYCSKHPSKLYSIDPFPLFNVDDLVDKHQGCFTFYQSLSLNSLPLIDSFDLVFIDGDHNWYTVINELKLIEKKCQKNNDEFPLVLFHDIGWPYGRRDLYYNPDNIPEKYRKRYEKKGMEPGSADLLEKGGLNADLYNAVHENDSQNGVLTAIEDFLKNTSLELEIVTLPGLYGLGILFPTKLLKKNSKFEAFVTQIKIDPVLREYIEKIETDRILKQMAVNRRDDELVRVNLRIENIVKDHESNMRKNEQLTQTVKEFEKKIHLKKEKNKALRKCIEKIETDFNSMLDSRRWKIGNIIGEVLRKIMFKKKVPMAFENIQQTFKQYFDREIGKMSGSGKNRSCLSFDFLSSQCKNLIPLKIVDQSLNALAQKTISIIVPVYNAYDETQNCIESIIENTTLSYELILINDASSDNRIIELLDRYKHLPCVQVLTNQKNLGFVKTVNLGMEKAQGDVVLLNSDTMVTPRWLQKLLLAAYSDPLIATVTPFSNASGAFSVPEIGKNLEIVPHLTLSGMAHIVERVSHQKYPRVPTGNGFCLYIKRKVIDEIGLFDALNFNKGYGEENDFCMRAIKKGWQHIIDDSSFIYHKNSASFSTDKDKLIKQNRKTLNRLHPEYTGLVKKFIASPELKKIRSVIKSEMGAGDRKSDALRILYVMHEGIGGTPATNQDLMQHVSQDHECFLLTSTTTDLIVRYVKKDVVTQLFRYKLSNTWSAKEFESDEFRTLYFSILVNLKIEIVHIRHLFKHCFELPIICRRLGLGVILSFHDFYHVCPSIQLLNQHTKYCEAQCRGEGQCLIPTPLLSDLPELRRWLPTWQKAVGNIIEACHAFVTTSESAKKIYIDAYPSLKEKRFAVIEHGRDFSLNLNGCNGSSDRKSKIKILIPGHIDVHKGSRFIKALNKHDKAERFEFHFLGTIPDDLKDCGIYHGTYERDNFHDKFSQICPSFVGIFSIWPETYCHTLSEAWACGIPVLAFNLGAVGERIVKHNGGWFLDREDVQTSYNRILDIVEKSSEYQNILTSVQKIRSKTTRQMADEYLKEYHNVRLLMSRKTTKHKTIALFTPKGTNGYPGSSYVRCLLPLQHPEFLKHFSLKLIPQGADRAYLDQLSNESVIDYVFIQRDVLIGEPMDDVISWCRENKVPLIYEIDDNLMGIDASHPDYDSYKSKIKAVEKLCCSANLVTVSTPELKKSLANYSSNIQVIKNALDENLWFSPMPHLKKRASTKVVHVGYMGTFTHDSDLALLKDVISEVKSILAKEHGITMEFFMIGGQKDKLAQRSWYNRINIPGSESTYPNFVKWLRQNVAWDIAVAPLENNLLNNSKSELKFFEYTALGAAGIYSSYGGYAHAINHRENGLLVKDNSIETWKAYLIELARDEKLRQQIVTRAKNSVVKNHLLKQRVFEWISAFDDVETSCKINDIHKVGIL